MKMLKTNKEEKCSQDFGGEENQKANREGELNPMCRPSWRKFIARHTITLADYHALALTPANISQTCVR